MKKKVDKDTNFDGGGKNRITAAGKYHLLVVGPSAGVDGIEQDDQAIMECKVIGAADPSQLDKTCELRVDFEIRFPSDDEEKLKKQQHMVDGMIAQVTSALNLTEMTRQEVATMEKWRGWIGTDVEFNFEQAIGRQFVAEIEMREFDLKDRETGQPTGEKGHVPDIRPYWRIFSPVDPKVASGGYPLNPQYVEMLGGTAPPRPPQDPPSAGQPAKPNPPAPSTPPEAAKPDPDDPWASFA